MFYLTSKFHVSRVNTFGFMEGGGKRGAFEASPPPTSRELQKSPDGIGLTHFKCISRLDLYGYVVFDKKSATVFLVFLNSAAKIS